MNQCNGLTRGKDEIDIKNKIIRYFEVASGYMKGEDDPNNPGTPLSEDTPDLTFSQYGQDVPIKEILSWPYDEQGNFTGIELES